MKEQKIRLKIAELNYNNLKSKKADSYQIKMAELNLEMEKVETSKLSEKLKQKKLIAGMDGIITYVDSMRIGAPISPYTTMFIISSNEHFLIECTEKANLEVGMKGQIDYNGKMYDGMVVSSSVSEDKSSSVGSIKKSALISIKNFDNKNAVSGNDVKLYIETMRIDNVLKIPFNALHSYNENSYVYVLENGVKTERSVRVGYANNSEVGILSGLKEGEEVVID